ncbi:NADH-quinone oxidoreductase subunit B family protein [Hydrogenimonas sp.]
MKVLWIQGVTCNGNGHSFLNASDLPQLLELFDFLYHPVLPGRHTLAEVAGGGLTPDILVVEGALREEGVPRGGREAFDLAVHYAQKARHIVCVGNCASFGGLFRQRDRKALSGAVFAGEEGEGPLARFRDKVVNLPGCPIHPQWLSYTLRMLHAGRPLKLDRWLRPLELYGYTVHEGCLRNEYFEWKVDAEGFGRKEGCLFYEQGCQGPYTHGSCNKILWNGVSSKTRAGMPCIGCTEPDFPASGLFRTHTLMSIPARLPLEVPKRAYLTLTGVAKAFKIPRLARRKFEEK